MVVLAPEVTPILFAMYSENTLPIPDTMQKMKYSTSKSSGDITFIRFHGRFGTRGHAHFVCDVF